MNVAFGAGSVGRSGSASRATNSLTTDNLKKFNRRSNSSAGFKKPIDPEVAVFTGEESKVAPVNAKPPVVQHKNYGKVPKYLNKYKEEADEVAKQKAEERASKLLPPGMK